jgi:hypothetical protein
MPIAAIASNPGLPGVPSGESTYRAAAPAQTTIAAGAEAASPAAQTQTQEPGIGDLAMVHDFDPERIQRLLKLLE